VVSLSEKAKARLARTRLPVEWLQLDQIRKKVIEPNGLAIAEAIAARAARAKKEAAVAEAVAAKAAQVKKEAAVAETIAAKAAKARKEDAFASVLPGPTMDALACRWAALHDASVRVVAGRDIWRIIEGGTHAFNLRVADPYLPYQRQGFGFTWSFFGSKDKQDVHVHGIPSVELYGVIKGRLQIWYKPLNERGVTRWRSAIAGPGDWIEVEPLQCHFACWLDPDGRGTVIKASGSGELAGVGKIGEKGKTTCDYCYGRPCEFHPRMRELVEEFKKPYEERDIRKIAKLGAATEPSGRGAERGARASSAPRGRRRTSSGSAV
jgi:hypothetical protein